MSAREYAYWPGEFQETPWELSDNASAKTDTAFVEMTRPSISCIPCGLVVDTLYWLVDGVRIAHGRCTQCHRDYVIESRMFVRTEDAVMIPSTSYRYKRTIMRSSHG